MEHFVLRLVLFLVKRHNWKAHYWPTLWCNDGLLHLFQVTFLLIDQNQREHVIDTFRPDLSSMSFQRPVSEMNVASGCPLFCPLARLRSPKHAYCKDDTLFIKCVVDSSWMLNDDITEEEGTEVRLSGLLLQDISLWVTKCALNHSFAAVPRTYCTQHFAD